MSFFYAASSAPRKVAPKPGSRGAIPIALMQEMGCNACPRDAEAKKLYSPKLKPSGVKDPTVYILGTSPSEEDDDANDHWRETGGAAIYEAFGQKFMQTDVRSNYIVQCRGEVTEQVTECCRRRIIADIEATKPQIIVTVGDLPLRWIMGPMSKAPNAMFMRGSVMVAKIGNHACHVVPLIYPNYAYKKKSSYGKKSEHELILELDVDMIKQAARNGGFGKVWVPKKEEFTKNIELVQDLRLLEKRLSDLACLDRVGFDIETNGLRPFRLKEPLLLTAAIGTLEHTIAFPVDHPQGFDTPKQRFMARSMLGEFLLFSGRKICHNLSMEMEWTNYFYGPEPLRLSEWEDTMAMAHTMDERKGTKSLEYQTIIHFGFNLKMQSKVDSRRLLEYPLKDTLMYNGMDAKWTHALGEKVLPTIQADPVLLAEYERKVRLAPTLVITEAKGMPASLEHAKELKAEFDKIVEDAERKLKHTEEVRAYEKRFGKFDPGNPDQVLKLMKDVCKRSEVIVTDQRTGKVQETTQEEVLASIPAREVPSAALILDHRGAQKVIGTYLMPVISGQILDRDGMIRAKYSSMVAETGRLASDDPNIQNWPKRKFKQVRRIATTDAWVTEVTLANGTVLRIEENRCFLSCDYGQIEFRVVGMASEDEEIVKACWTGYDVHMFWAERIVALYPEIKDVIGREFKIDWDEKGLKTLRQESKNKWVFPQLFGSSVRSCAAALWLPEHVAEDLSAEFWDAFRGAKRWQDKLMKIYERTGQVQTLGGRARRGAMTKNQVINHPIQGTAADIVTTAMAELSELGHANDDPDLIPNLNVHDDLSFLPKVDRVDEVLKIVTTAMCRHHFDWINVPLMVEASVGTNWFNIEEIGKFRSDELFGIPNPYKA